MTRFEYLSSRRGEPIIIGPEGCTQGASQNPRPNTSCDIMCLHGS